jgi:anti-anti-sigma factor
VELPEFSVSVASLTDCEVVTVSGELDMLTSPELSAAIASLDGTKRPVAVDLSTLTFIDSTGVRALVTARTGGQPLILICPDGQVARVLEILQIEKVLTVYKQLDDLVASLAAPGQEDGT